MAHRLGKRCEMNLPDSVVTPKYSQAENRDDPAKQLNFP